MGTKNIDNITDEQIIDYLKYVEKSFSDNTIDTLICNNLKEHIEKSDRCYGYKEKTLDFLDREIENIKRTIPIKKSIGEPYQIINYLRNIIENKEHFFYEAFQEIIINKCTGLKYVFSPKRNEIFNFNYIIGTILEYILILELYEEEKKHKLVRKRDKHKINDAINLLLKYTNNVQDKYYLNNMLKEVNSDTISKDILLSCYFCRITKILLEFNKTISKNRARLITKEIMEQVFDSFKDYRILKYTKQIKYKGFNYIKYSDTPPIID